MRSAFENRLRNLDTLANMPSSLSESPESWYHNSALDISHCHIAIFSRSLFMTSIQFSTGHRSWSGTRICTQCILMYFSKNIQHTENWRAFIIKKGSRRLLCFYKIVMDIEPYLNPPTCFARSGSHRPSVPILLYDLRVVPPHHYCRSRRPCSLIEKYQRKALAPPFCTVHRCCANALG